MVLGGVAMDFLVFTVNWNVTHVESSGIGARGKGGGLHGHEASKAPTARYDAALGAAS